MVAVEVVAEEVVAVAVPMSDTEVVAYAAYAYVIVGSFLVTIGVYLFVHRSNALMVLPCFRWMKG